MREHRRDTNKTVNADGLMQHSEDDFGNHLASRLSHQDGRLDAVVSERLRVARMRALAMRKLAPSGPSGPSGPRMANGSWSKTFAPWTTMQIYDRVMFGHWGGNFIKGAGNKILGGRAACAFRQLDAVRS